MRIGKVSVASCVNVFLRIKSDGLCLY
uniref:Uncharacterized protein n=1 Tax=Anguilla anguilla TaxID=7936 RepID=A0A0E9RZ40_ANGAN